MICRILSMKLVNTPQIKEHNAVEWSPHGLQSQPSRRTLLFKKYAAQMVVLYHILLNDGVWMDGKKLKHNTIDLANHSYSWALLSKPKFNRRRFSSRSQRLQGLSIFGTGTFSSPNDTLEMWPQQKSPQDIPRHAALGKGFPRVCTPRFSLLFLPHHITTAVVQAEGRRIIVRMQV